MGKYRHVDTGSVVDAWRFNGTDEIAKLMEDEITARGGEFTWVPKGQFDYDLHNAYGQLERHVDYYKEPIFEMVKDGDWVVDVQPEHETGSFYTVHAKKFEKLYTPVILGGTL